MTQSTTTSDPSGVIRRIYADITAACDAATRECRRPAGRGSGEPRAGCCGESPDEEER